MKGCGERMGYLGLDYEYCGQDRHPKQSKLYCEKCYPKYKELKERLSLKTSEAKEKKNV